jgi:hypothetical protein
MSEIQLVTKDTALVAPRPQFIPQPTNFDEAWRISTMLASSDLVPKDYKGKPENVCVAMQWGADIGLPGLQALQNIAVINGRPSIWGDAAKALVLVHSACEDIEERIEGEGDLRTAICVAKRRGKTPSVQRFSVADAKRAGLWNKAGPWQNYPDRMLQMRARGFALRDAFPDALKGLLLAEEAQDIVPADKPAGVEGKPDSSNGFMPKARPAALPADIPHDKVPEAVPEQPAAQPAERQAEKPAPTAQQKAAPPVEGEPTLQPGMIRVARTKMEQHGRAEADVVAHFGVTALEEIPVSKVNELLKYIDKGE